MIKKGDFVKFDFIGKVKESGDVFDLTIEEEAKKLKIYNEKASYKPLIICVGEGDIVKGLDDALVGKELKEYDIEVPYEKGFGRKDPKLMKLVSAGMFKKQEIKPFPGLQVNLDGYMGVIRSVSGGRVVIDFNHPLAGRNLVYHVKIKRILKDDKEKVKAFVDLHLKGTDYELKDNEVVIKTKLPKEITDKVAEKLKKVVKSIKKVDFQKQ